MNTPAYANELTGHQRELLRAYPQIGTLRKAAGHFNFYAFVGDKLIESPAIRDVVLAIDPDTALVDDVVPADHSLKDFRVEVKLQYSAFGTGYSGRAGEWGTFGKYSARTKAEAIEQARSYNRTHCMLESDHGLVWFRAIEE